MRLLILTITSILAITANAEIYTWKDANGNTVFGDNPPEAKKAKTVTVSEPTIIPSYKSPDTDTTSKDTKKDDDKSKGYESFTVAYPTDDLAVRSNDGNIDVSFDLTPGLQDGHTIFIYVDGKKIDEGGTALSASLQNLDRGTHSLFAVVRTDEGDVLINSNTVKFHIQRNSIINNQTNNNAQPQSPTTLTNPFSALLPANQPSNTTTNTIN